MNPTPEMTSTFDFVYKLKQLAKNVYSSNDIPKLQEELNNLNRIYNDLMASNNVLHLEKEFVLKKYTPITEINAESAPMLKSQAKTLGTRYNNFHFENHTFEN